VSETVVDASFPAKLGDAAVSGGRRPLSTRRDAHEVVPFISNRGEDSWHILGGDVASSGGMESS
jgi:hypothetical protein